MVLSLSDILTTQAVERPQAASFNRRGLSDLLPGQAAKFKDYLNKPEPNNANPAINKPEFETKNLSWKSNDIIKKYNFSKDINNQPVDGVAVTSAVSNPDTNIDNTNQQAGSATDKNFSPEQKTKLADLYQALKNQKETGAALSDENIQTLEGILPQLVGKGIPAGISAQQLVVQDGTSPKLGETLPNLIGEIANPGASQAQQVISKDDLFNAVSQLQADGANLSDDTIKILDEVLPKLAGKNIPADMSAKDVVLKVVAQVANPDNTIDDILQKMNFANASKTETLTAEQLAAAVLATQHAGIDISKIASKVIEVAKIEAGKPQIPASNIKMIQVESLINSNKKRDKDSKAGDNNALDGLDFTNIQALDNNNKKEISKNTVEQLQNVTVSAKDVIDQKQLADTFSIGSKGEQNPGNNPNNITQPTPLNIAAGDATKQVVAQAAAKNEMGATGKIENASNTLSGMSSENFVKFQNMLEDAQEVTKNAPAKLLHSPAEIIAQIKFGMSGMNGKDERNISIQLHPKDLGKVDINMQMGHDGKTHVMIMAENTDTLNLMQKEASSLKDMLTDALKTDSGNLNFSFHEKGSDGWKQQFANNQYGSGSKVGRTDTASASDYLAAQSYRYNMIATEGLDIRV